jgi:hypothetical protein
MALPICLLQRNFLHLGCQENDFYPEEDISASLKQQVKEELDLQGAKKNDAAAETKRLKSNKVRNRILITIGIILGVLILFSLFLVGTKTGRKLIYRFAGGYIYDQLDKDQTVPANSNLPSDNTQTSGTQTGGNTAGNTQSTPGLRQESYVTNYLIFGIEEIEGASNTDSMMIASINTMVDTVKLTSLLRDTYIELPGEKPRKLNAIYDAVGAGLDAVFVVSSLGFAVG